MKRPTEGDATGEGRPLRVCLDLNVFVAALLAAERGRRDTAAQVLVDSIRRGESALGPMQLVISWGMLNRLRKVLERDLRIAPEQLDPVLTLGGTGVIPLPDEEDRHVLETASAGGAGVVVTSNLGDFTIRGTQVLEADRVLEYHVPKGRIVIAHPFRAAEWLRKGRITLPESRSQP